MSEQSPLGQSSKSSVFVSDPWTSTNLQYLSPMYPMKVKTQKLSPNKVSQNFQFVDQTPGLYEANNKTRCPVDMDKRRIAQQKRRDKNGKFIQFEVAARLDALERELKARESECNNLRQSINERNAEMEILKEQMHELISESPLPDDPTCAYSPANNFEYQPIGSTYPFFPVQTTNRNYFSVPSPSPQFAFQGQEAFKEKIDYSKIQLRKIEDSYLDEVKREVLSSEEAWAYKQKQNEFIRKIREQERWQQSQFQPDPRLTSSAPIYGGAPSNIYPETLNKVGNLQVPAFTTKLDLTNAKRRAFKRERSFENLLSDEQVQLLSRMIQARQMQQNNRYQNISEIYLDNLTNEIASTSQVSSSSPTSGLHSPQIDQSQAGNYFDDIASPQSQSIESPNAEMKDSFVIQSNPRSLSRRRTMSLSASTPGTQDGLYLGSRRDSYTFPPPPPPPPSPVNSHLHRHKRSQNLRQLHQQYRKNTNSPNRSKEIEEIYIDCKPENFTQQQQQQSQPSVLQQQKQEQLQRRSLPQSILLDISHLRQRQEEIINENNEGVELTSPSKKIKMGGPPSNIYTPPEKIGNLQVPAFTTKIDYSVIELKKT